VSGYCLNPELASGHETSRVLETYLPGAGMDWIDPSFGLLDQITFMFHWLIIQTKQNINPQEAMP